jgi:hypothetical protein
MPFFLWLPVDVLGVPVFITATDVVREQRAISPIELELAAR